MLLGIVLLYMESAKIKDVTVKRKEKPTVCGQGFFWLLPMSPLSVQQQYHD